MVRSDSGRLKALILCISVVVAGLACTDSPKNAAGPGGPTTLPTPTPAPAPSPSPTPGASPSANGITLDVAFYGSQECKRGIGPSGSEALRVGCSVEVRTTPRDPGGTPVPQSTTGTNVVWVVDEGGARVTLPWDVAPWKRWLTGVAPGHFRIVVTLTQRSGDKAVGVLDGEIVE